MSLLMDCGAARFLGVGGWGYYFVLPTPFVDGVPWSTPWLMAANYAAMFCVYCWLVWNFRRRGS